jgi:hypothetical protein
MREIVEGRVYLPDEAARIIGSSVDSMIDCLALRGHRGGFPPGGLTAGQVEEAWEALNPYLVAGVPSAGRVSADDEAALRQLWRAQDSAVSTPTVVQLRFPTEAQARAAAESLPSYPGFTWTCLHVSPGESGCESYQSSLDGDEAVTPPV